MHFLTGRPSLTQGLYIVVAPNLGVASFSTKHQICKHPLRKHRGAYGNVNIHFRIINLSDTFATLD